MPSDDLARLHSRPAGRRGCASSSDKACFRNALLVVLKHPDLYEYAEGLAWSKFGPVHHAWVVDAEGHAVDVTWREPGSRYYGRTFAVWVN